MSTHNICFCGELRKIIIGIPPPYLERFFPLLWAKNLDFNLIFFLVLQECSNEVEAFSLDENFDYDNVVLTPKYSPEDMERISTLMKANVTL